MRHRLLTVCAWVVVALCSMSATGLRLAAQQAPADRAAGILTPAMLGQETPAVKPVAAEAPVAKPATAETPVAKSSAAEPPPAPALSSKTVQFLSDTTFSGFVSTSYFFNFNNPSSNLTTGRSFDQKSDEFALNKLHLTIDNAVEYSGEKWDAGFHTDVLFGEDARLIQSSGLALGTQGDLESAFIVINAPIGNGIQLSAGKWATFMGVEVIEETVNPNFSEGNQFLFVENSTHLGVQIGYKWCDYFETRARMTNGWDVVKDNNNAKSYMGILIFTPSKETTITLVPYGGPEQVGISSAWRSGIDAVVSQTVTPEFKAWLQLDYGHEDKSAALPDPTTDAEWFAAGIWLTYDISKLVSDNNVVLALRGDYLNDPDGARTSAAPFTAPFPVNTGQELYSLTFTVNYSPLPSVQIRPELRWDHSDRNTAFDGDDDQVTAGCGVAYIF